nr:hypothetical protein [Tanacetum cinerariifolium]
MSDSEDSTVTYTEVSSPFEDLSNIRSSRVDGLPMMPQDPYAYMEAALQALSSPDYVPGPEHPHTPDFVSEPVYLKFMPPEDDVLPAEEQPLPAAVSPITDSPRYIPESDPEEDPKEDDEDPEEDLADYPTNRDDDDDEEEEDEESSGDKADDEDEEEHPALADSIPPPPVHRTTARISILVQIPSPILPVSPTLPESSPPLPASLTYPLGYRATMIRLRAETPSTSHPLPSSTPPSGTPPLLPIHLPTLSPPFLLPSTSHRADVLEVTLPPWKWLCIALGLRFEIGKSSSAPTTRPMGGFRVDYGFVRTLDDEIRKDPEREVGYGIIDTWDKMLVGMLRVLATDEIELGRRLTDFVTTVRQDTGDRRTHARTARLTESEAKLSRKAWVQSIGASDTARTKVMSLHTTVVAQKLEITGLPLQRRQGPARGPAHPESQVTILRPMGYGPTTLPPRHSDASTDKFRARTKSGSCSTLLPVPVNSADRPSSTAIDQDAPSSIHSPSSSALQSLCLHQGIAAKSSLMDENPFAPVNN